MQIRTVDDGVRVAVLAWRVLRLATAVVVAGIAALWVLTSDLPRYVLLFPVAVVALSAYRVLRPTRSTAPAPAATTYTATRRPLPMTWTARAMVPVGPIGRMEVDWPHGRLDVDHGRAVLSCTGQPGGPWSFDSETSRVVPLRIGDLDSAFALRVVGTRDVIVGVQQRADVLATLATAGFAVQQAEESISPLDAVVG